MSAGAFSLVETAQSAGVEVCFANAVTTEAPIVEALDRYQECMSYSESSRASARAPPTVGHA